MRLIRLILINIKRQLKNPSMMIMTLIFPVVMLIFINGDGFGTESGSVGIIDKSNSKYSKELIGKLEEQYDIEKLNGKVEDSFNLLRENKLGIIYVIDKNFNEKLQLGEVPKVHSYKTEAASGTIISDEIIKDYVLSVVKEGISDGLSENSIITIINEDKIKDTDNYSMTIVMICYFMMIGGSVVSSEIIKLKDQKVLKRTISTSNSDISILGSLFISSFIYQGILSSIGFIILTFIFKFPIDKIPEGVFIIFLGSIFTTAIIVAITRWVKNGVLASLITVLFGLLAFGLGMFSFELDAFSNVPELLYRLSVMSPFTWMLKIINTGKIIIPTIIILLMSIVFFTAGSFKLREFVKE